MANISENEKWHTSHTTYRLTLPILKTYNSISITTQFLPTGTLKGHNGNAAADRQANAFSQSEQVMETNFNQ